MPGKKVKKGGTLGIDMEIFESTREIMEDSFALMITYYLEDSKEYINKIGKALEIGQISDIMSPSHTLTSSSRQLGALALADVAEKIEICAKNIKKERNNTPDIKKLKQLYKQLQEIFSGVETFFVQFG